MRIKLIFLSLSFLILSIFSSCKTSGGSSDGGKKSGNDENAGRIWITKMPYKKAFEEFLQPALVNKCVECHGAGSSIPIASANVDQALKATGFNRHAPPDTFSESAWGVRATDGHCGNRCFDTDAEVKTGFQLFYQYGLKEIEPPFRDYFDEITLERGSVKVFPAVWQEQRQLTWIERRELEGWGTSSKLGKIGPFRLQGVFFEVEMRLIPAPSHWGVRLSNPRIVIDCSGVFRIKGLKIQGVPFHPSQRAWESVEATVDALSPAVPLSNETVTVHSIDPVTISFDEFEWSESESEEHE